MAHHVFLSYSNADKSAADLVYSALNSAGVPCWMAPNDIPPGSSWAKSIVSAISDCQIVVLLFSESSNSSDWVERELHEAARLRRPILTFRLEPASPSPEVHILTIKHQWLDAFPQPFTNHLPRLVEATR